MFRCFFACYLGGFVPLLALFIWVCVLSGNPGEAGIGVLVLMLASPVISLVPAGLVLVSLGLLGRFGKRVIRPHSRRYAFLIGAMTVVLFGLCGSEAANELLERMKVVGGVLLVGSCIGLPVGLSVLLTCRPVQAGCCLKCGYDLRASKERCPECGAVVAGILGV